jgi:hypothetical protein
LPVIESTTAADCSAVPPSPMLITCVEDKLIVGAAVVPPTVKVLLPTEVTYANVGMSLATNARKEGCAALPVAGPANTTFAACVFNVRVKVPLAVNGELPTVYMGAVLTSDKPTEDKNVPPLVALAVNALVFGLKFQDTPPPSENIRQRAVARKFPVSLTVVI